MDRDTTINACIDVFVEKSWEIDLFRKAVADYFTNNPALNMVGNPPLHSIRSRMKDHEHLREKLARKWDEGNPITPANLFDCVTDLGGVRVLHLYQDQFPEIHNEIIKKVNATDWSLNEEPKAYTWDPESEEFFKKYVAKVERKESFYTSIHYVVRPRPDSFIRVEIQVRTLFEEAWGEIDHRINYPTSTTILACREQISVLAKLVGAGSRLADSIFRSHHDGKK